MPRAKRALAEADSNATLLPSPKHAKITKTTKTGKPIVVEEDVSAKPDYESKSKEELVAILKERLMPSTGTKEMLIRRLQDNENDGSPTTPKVSSRKVADHSPAPAVTHQSKADEEAALPTGRSRSMHTSSVTSSSSSNNVVTAKKDGDGMNYKTKDNSKLARLLDERRLGLAGSRDEMIHRLETSCYNYNAYSSEELSQMLSERHLVNASLGDKALKIERLKLNDQSDCDRGNSREIIMYCNLNFKEETIEELEEALDFMESGSTFYDTLSTRSLPYVATILGVSNAGQNVVRRLENNDRNSKRPPLSQIRKSVHETKKRLERLKKEYTKEKAELEAIVGHPVEPRKVFKQIDELGKRDRLLQDSYQPARKSQPSCVVNYDWKSSHWATRSSQELHDICRRQGWFGGETKAACIMWLETGEVDYELLSVMSLERICKDRGIKIRSNEKRIDLVKKIRDSDEAEAKLSEKERKELMKARRPKDRLLRELA
ncbi:hypothetical protein CJF31_00003462 [Rutstroemia sp. NJR-2017a BVV2]|nr:hypothetical protein CJF31_00003462 [Rutstroemia sp. NJR-2017a BVV2]